MENTFFEEPEYPLIHKIKSSCILFTKYALALLITLLFIKSIEYVFITFNEQLPEAFTEVVIKGLYSDTLFFLKSLPFLYVLFAFIFFIVKEKRGIYIVTGILFSIYILVHLLLVKYFFTALVPLGADLYGYSIADIRQTIYSGARIDLFSLFLIILPLLFLWLVLWFFSKINFLKFSYAATLMIFGLLLIYFDVSAIPVYKSLKSDYSFNLAVNKSAFFFERSYQHFFDNEPEVDIYDSNYFDEEGQIIGAPVYKYVSNEYPFLRENNIPDALGNFFKIDTAKRPNIVIMQVEGLGRAFSGPGAYLGSFTPYLDHLQTQGLYWGNFLSAQGRTFASLPSILGSLPFFEKGYNNLGDKMPKTITTLSLLKHNGYSTSFFIGTDLEFDNEGTFIRKQGIDKIVSKFDFEDFPASDNSSWGYPDMDLMKKTLYSLSGKQKKPFLSYIQTISMHSPYQVPDMKKYYSLFEQHMVKLGFNEQQKQEHRAYRDQYASIMYTDDAIQYFMNEFSKSPNYANTIFLITGDHRLPEIPMSTKIDRYHVPLIIFSPLLKRTASFRSVSNHLDITPSLTAFLAHNYKINSPSLVSWVGSGLDTVRQFRNVKKYPLKQTVNDLMDYVSGDYFLNENTLFKLKNNMDIEPVQDDAKLNQMKGEFNQYKSLNNRLSRSLQLIPDSLYNKYKP